MREIKFRAWHGETKRMSESFELLSMGVPFSGGDRLFMYFGEDGNELMQYTGLKDKNGKEIYEGDLIEWRYDPLYPSVCKYPYPYIVEWQPDQAQYRRVIYQGGSRLELDEHIAKEYEVVGNIHENPELIPK
jgi:uncharacterized phage protein (TIGR01671 family)